jgi:hypothetical protein
LRRCTIPLRIIDVQAYELLAFHLTLKLSLAAALADVAPQPWQLVTMV